MAFRCSAMCFHPPTLCPVSQMTVGFVRKVCQRPIKPVSWVTCPNPSWTASGRMSTPHFAEQVQGGEHRDGVGLLYLSGKLADHLAVFYGGELPVYHRQPSGPLQHSHAQGVVERCSCLSRLVLEEVENGAFLCLPQKDGYAFLIMPAFSAAIFSSVSPKNCV